MSFFIGFALGQLAFVLLVVIIVWHEDRKWIAPEPPKKKITYAPDQLPKKLAPFVRRSELLGMEKDV